MSTLTLPMPVSVNQMYARGKNGQVYLTAKARSWKLAAAWEYHSQRRRITRLTGPYTLHVVLNSVRRSGDADNRLKIVSDLLVKLGVTPDDRLCESATASWDDTGTVPKGMCRVEIKPASVQRATAA